MPNYYVRTYYVVTGLCKPVLAMLVAILHTNLITQLVNWNRNNKHYNKFTNLIQPTLTEESPIGICIWFRQV